MNTVLLIIVFIFLAIYFWYSSMRAKELATKVGSHLCAKHNVIFLDDTVAIKKISIARDGNARLCLKRVYQFEYSSSEDQRLVGFITVLGVKVVDSSFTIASAKVSQEKTNKKNAATIIDFTSAKAKNEERKH